MTPPIGIGGNGSPAFTPHKPAPPGKKATPGILAGTGTTPSGYGVTAAMSAKRRSTGCMGLVLIKKERRSGQRQPAGLATNCLHEDRRVRAQHRLVLFMGGRP